MEPELDVTVTVNGDAVQARVPVRMHAADFLRTCVGLTGTHVGCEQGVCGMCTILVDGRAVKSCLMLAAQLDGRDVRTVESLAPDDLAPLQEEFRTAHGLQCGFCTPAYLMTATALAEEDREFSRHDIREEIAGVLCRCTGYENVVDAIEQHLNRRRHDPAPTVKH